MPAPTVSFITLRRAICRELRMPFFRRIGNESSVAAGATAIRVTDPDLTQKDKYWNNSFFYHVDSEESSLILSYNANTHELLLERPLPTIPVAADTYEIHSIWNADDIREATNRAIQSARQTFFITAINEDTCMVTDVLQYRLTVAAFDTSVWILNKIYVEYPTNAAQFDASSATSTTVTAPSTADLTDVENGWILTVYDGDGAGQVRSVSSVAGQVITIESAWDNQPDTTSRIKVFDPNKSSWYPFHNFHTDSVEYPTFVRFSHRNPDYDGGRFRFEYLGVSPTVDADDDLIYLPQEYLINKVCSLLHGQVLNGTKSDKEAHYAEFKRYQEEADSYLVRNAPHSPSIHMRHPDAHVNSFYRDREDPLNWNL